MRFCYKADDKLLHKGIKGIRKLGCGRLSELGGTVMRITKLNIFPVPVRLHYGYGKLIFVIISTFFAIFKNVVHSLEPGETPSNSASHQVPNYAQRS